MVARLHAFPLPPWNSLTAVVAVDVRSGQVTRVTPANGASWSLLAMSNGGWVGAWLREAAHGCGRRLWQVE